MLETPAKMTWVYDFDHPHGLGRDALRGLIGGKAANLTVMATELGLPVPPGFTVTTEACRAYLAHGWPDGLTDELRAHMVRVEGKVGRRFGDPAAPLLVSVRSGAPVSMPGMMDTILNLGLNDATARGLADASHDPAFAADCLRRFTEMYRDIVGVETVPDDPWEQLRAAVEAVFRSWNSERAIAYRRHEGIPDDLGTAVTVQAMVFGNLGADSGTGVVFTRNPATGERTLYGDVMFNAQGEDVVAGTHRTEPIEVLDERLPAVAAELRAYAETLERHYADLCDIEFTVERAKLWMLQVRSGKRSPEAALRIALEMAESPDFPLSRAEAVQRVASILADPPTTVAERSAVAPPVARGLPASPGVATGEIATSPDAAIAAADAGRDAILVRRETSPDDVHGMARAVGILTSTGGFVSHAAVVARGWGIPAVVGAAEVAVADGEVRIGEATFREGDRITIDGTTGEVFAGEVDGRRVVVPEAATLLDWARELGVEIERRAAEVAPPSVAPPGAAPTPAPAAEPGGPPSRDVLIRLLGIKGYGTPESLGAALGSAVDETSQVLDRLVADGLAELSAGAFRLTIDGKAICREQIAAERERWGPERADSAIEEFQAFDVRMKDVVTRWQMREIDGEQVFNDHADPEYDGEILDRLAALHRDAGTWLTPLVDACPVLDGYLRRLSRALDQASGGDARFVASPRLDSYHSIWFELHEELIRLAGRKRADEAAAGRG